MKSKKQMVVTRRQFLLTGLAGVAGVALSRFALGDDASSAATEPVTSGTVLIRNPAFSKKKSGDATVVSTTTSNRQTIAYRLDAEAEFVWDEIPTAEANLSGAKVTSQEIADKAVKKYASRDPQSVRREVLAFLKEAAAAGLVLQPSNRVYYTATKPLQSK